MIFTTSLCAFTVPLYWLLCTASWLFTVNESLIQTQLSYMSLCPWDFANNTVSISRFHRNVPRNVVPVWFSRWDFPRERTRRDAMAYLQNFDNSSFILCFSENALLCYRLIQQRVINNYYRQRAAYHNFTIYIPLCGNQHVSPCRCFRHDRTACIVLVLELVSRSPEQPSASL